MAEYHRILSYLYRYDYRDKIDCKGFVKAEQRRNGLKLTLQIDDERLMEEINLILYVYGKKGETWEIQRLATLQSGRHREEMSSFYPTEQLPKGFDIQTKYGVILFYQKSLYYGSVWIGDEIPIDDLLWQMNSGMDVISEEKKENSQSFDGENKRDSFSDEKSKNDKSADRENEGNIFLDGEAKVKEDEPADGRRKKNTFLNKESEMRTTVEEESDSDTASDEESKTDMSAGGRVENDIFSDEKSKEKVDESDEGRSRNAIFIRKDSKIDKSSDRENKVDAFVRERENVTEKEDSDLKSVHNLVNNVNTDSPVKPESDHFVDTEKDLEDKVESTEQITENIVDKSEKKKAIFTKPGDSIQKMWMKISKNTKPVDNIFNAAFREGYQITIDQMKDFCPDAHLFQENQFLVNGYKVYHHLLTAKVMYAGEERFCIGVPGIYENRERYMAQIYQFPVFLSMTENRIKTGGFGYWLHLL